MSPQVFTVDLPGLGCPPPPTPFEEAIALTGYGKFHRLLLLSCGMALASVIAITINTSYVLPLAGCEFLMSASEKGLLNSMCYIGMICSSHLWGYLADTRGRKPVIMAGFLMDTACTVASSFTHSFWLYLVLRFLNGFAINASAAVNYAYLGEFHPAATRTQAIMWCGVFVSLASIVLPGVAWAVIPQPWSVQLPAYQYGSWRVFLVMCAAPNLVTAALFTLLPESPKFLVTRGRHKEALAVLRRIYRLNTGKPADTYPVQSVVLTEGSSPPFLTKDKPHSSKLQALAKSVWRQTAPLFVPPHLLYTTVTFLLMFACFCVGNGMLLWLPEIFNTVSQTSGGQSSVCAAYRGLGADNSSLQDPLWLNDSWEAGNPRGADNSSLQDPLWLNDSWGASNPRGADCSAGAVIDPSAFQNTLIVGGVSCAMYLLAGFAVRHIARKWFALMVLMVAAACGIGLINVTSMPLVLTLACLMVSVLFTGISILSSFIVDIFPTHLRGMAVSLGLMVGRIGTVSGSMLLGALLETNCDLVFYIVAAICLGCALLTFLLPGRK